MAKRDQKNKLVKKPLLQAGLAGLWFVAAVATGIGWTGPLVWLLDVLMVGVLLGAGVMVGVPVAKVAAKIFNGIFNRTGNQQEQVRNQERNLSREEVQTMDQLPEQENNLEVEVYDKNGALISEGRNTTKKITGPKK